eukprot:TRINITY_DN16456_c0_g2_i1.p1 TRINITY_DN16456_c0_g2~~TRINITY_DN16456_c0_g2_i1.p1  ORF type:complete len:280 (+),score=24.27 TRINITY_DN16456_c0_g2_i1:31-840(+)
MQLTLARLRHAVPGIAVLIWLLRYWWKRQRGSSQFDWQQNRNSVKGGGKGRARQPVDTVNSRSRVDGRVSGSNGLGEGRDTIRDHPLPSDGRGHVGRDRPLSGDGRGNAGRDRPLCSTAGRPKDFDLASKAPSSAPMPSLWDASARGETDVVKQLLQSRHDVNKTYKSWTPLMKAAEEGHCDCIGVLLEARAQLEAANSKGRTALSFAAAPSMGRVAVIPALELLLNAGASLRHKDSRGETARDRASRDGHSESVAAIDRFVASQRKSD